MEDLRSPRPRGFVRFELYLTAAALLIALAVLVPEVRNHGWKAGLVALLGIILTLAAIIGVLVGISWLVELAGREGSAAGAAARWLGHVLRFALCACLGAGLATALAAQHGLPVRAQNVVSLAGAALGGAAGAWLRVRLGPGRYWIAFGRLALALAGSLLFGLFGILVPGNWGVDLGIMVPLLVFAILAACGRIVPPAAPRSAP